MPIGEEINGMVSVIRSKMVVEYKGRRRSEKTDHTTDYRSGNMCNHAAIFLYIITSYVAYKSQNEGQPDRSPCQQGLEH
jgi:hypothetical protein